MQLLTQKKITLDWLGAPLKPVVSFSLHQDQSHLIFNAEREASFLAHPEGELGKFLPELWKYDVAELFLLDEKSGRYLEVNLSPEGSWWACWFDKPRRAEPSQPDWGGIMTACQITQNSWQTWLRLPLAILPELTQLRYNATFILNSPEQTFHTFAPLPGATPNFHQPDSFLPWPNEVRS